MCLCPPCACLWQQAFCLPAGWQAQANVQRQEGEKNRKAPLVDKLKIRRRTAGNSAPGGAVAGTAPLAEATVASAEPAAAAHTAIAAHSVEAVLPRAAAPKKLRWICGAAKKEVLAAAEGSTGVVTSRPGLPLQPSVNSSATSKNPARQP